jgi:hypothetical protein
MKEQKHCGGYSKTMVRGKRKRNEARSELKIRLGKKLENTGEMKMYVVRKRVCGTTENVKRSVLYTRVKEAVPLHAMEALGERGL